MIYWEEEIQSQERMEATRQKEKQIARKAGSDCVTGGNQPKERRNRIKGKAEINRKKERSLTDVKGKPINEKQNRIERKGRIQSQERKKPI